MNIQGNRDDLSKYHSYESASSSNTQEETSFKEDLVSQLEQMLSGYDRAALEEIQAREKEDSDWNALLDAVDRHIEILEEGMEVKSQEILEENLENERFKREFLFKIEPDTFH